MNNKTSDVNKATNGSAQIENLWPTDFGFIAISDTPLFILRQQASLLGEKTSNIVEGLVNSVVDERLTRDHIMAGLKSITTFLPENTNSENYTLHYRFYVKAPALGNYRYLLFSCFYDPITPYPVSIQFGDSTYEAKNENELKDHLRLIFSSEETRRVIASLMAQSLASATP